MSRYFSKSELQCHGEENYAEYGYSWGCGCGGGLIIDAQLELLIDTIREKLGSPLSCSCAYRCPVHNERVGGAYNSYHVQGKACDLIVPDGYDVDSFAQLCRDTMRELGIAGGVGRYYNSGFVHVDTRGYEAKWVG